jgi:hypothetical protein
MTQKQLLSSRVFKWIHIFKNYPHQVLVAHVCNPSYSGGRNQEDCSEASLANSSQDPISEILNIKIGLVEWLKVKALSSSPSTRKEKKSPHFQVLWKN